MKCQYKKRLFTLSIDNVTQSLQCVYNIDTESINVNMSTWKMDGKSMTNRMCSSFLGCHVAERVLSKVFNNVELMPYGNPGYDFKCGKDFLIDVKAATKHKRWGSWGFSIRKNVVADYFLCIGFDDRHNLNPEHIWLIPGNLIDHLTQIKMSSSTLDKWMEFELDKLDDVKMCCDSMRGNQR